MYLRLNSRINPVKFICLNKKKNEIQIKQAYAFSLTYLVILFCFIFFLTVIIEKFNFFIYFRLSLSYLDTLQNGHLSVNCTYLFYLFTISLCIYLHATSNIVLSQERLKKEQEEKEQKKKEKAEAHLYTIIKV